MKKILAITAVSLCSSPAFAGVYLNSEVNNSYTGSDYDNRTVDLHVGYEGSANKFDYYIQGGPAFTAVADVDGTETEFSAKAGGTWNVSQKLGIYGELSGITKKEVDNSYGSKLGLKYSF